MATHVKHRRSPKLPTMAVGGSLPSSEEDKENQEELAKKIEEFKKANPDKPIDSTPSLDSPLNLGVGTMSIEDEYINIAKKYLGIKGDGKPSLVEMSKAVINRIDGMMKIIQNQRKTISGFQNRTLFSSEENSSWQ